MSLDQLFFIVDIAGKGKKLIYAYPFQKIKIDEFKLNTDFIKNEQNEYNN